MDLFTSLRPALEGRNNSKPTMLFKILFLLLQRAERQCREKICERSKHLEENGYSLLRQKRGRQDLQGQ